MIVSCWDIPSGEWLLKWPLAWLVIPVINHWTGLFIVAYDYHFGLIDHWLVTIFSRHHATRLPATALVVSMYRYGHQSICWCNSPSKAGPRREDWGHPHPLFTNKIVSLWYPNHPKTHQVEPPSCSSRMPGEDAGKNPGTLSAYEQEQMLQVPSADPPQTSVMLRVASMADTSWSIRGTSSTGWMQTIKILATL